MCARVLPEVLKVAKSSRGQLMAQRFTKAVRESDAMMSRARVYADVNVQNSKDYWDYETLVHTSGGGSGLHALG